MVWIVILVIVALLVIALITLYNRFVRLRNRVDNAWAQIEVQLKRRWDLIPNLVETVKGYAEHERGTFEAVTEARANAQRAQGPAETAAAEGILGAALGRLFAVAEAYPELQADENFRQLQDELAGTENRIAVSRQVYNDTVLTYNNAIQTFPGVVLAGPFNFEKREFFETDVTQREAPQVDFGADAAPQRRQRLPRLPPRPQTRARAAHPVARRLGVLAAAAAAALTLAGVAQGQTYELVSSDVQANVRPDGSVAVDEAITVAFSGSFTYGFREVPLRDGERIDEIGVTENGRPFQPGASTELAARRTAGHVRRRGSRRARPCRLAVHLGRLRATDVRHPLPDRRSRDRLRRRRRRQPQGLGRRVGAAPRPADGDDARPGRRRARLGPPGLGARRRDDRRTRSHPPGARRRRGPVRGAPDALPT